MEIILYNVLKFTHCRYQSDPHHKLPSSKISQIEVQRYAREAYLIKTFEPMKYYNIRLQARNRMGQGLQWEKQLVAVSANDSELFFSYLPQPPKTPRRSEYLLNKHSLCNTTKSKLHSSTLLYLPIPTRDVYSGACQFEGNVSTNSVICDVGSDLYETMSKLFKIVMPR